jgi:signal transduction histidine kinase
MRLRSKLLIILLPVVLAGLTLQWVVSSYTQDRQMTNQQTALLGHLLDNAALRMINERHRVLETYDLENVEVYVDRYKSALLLELADLARRANVELIVADASGNTLLPSDRADENFGWVVDTDRMIDSSFVHELDGQPYLMVAREFAEWDWTIIAAYPLAAVKNAIRDVNLAITASLLAAGCCMALSLFVGVDRLVISPVRQLERKLRALGKGRRPDELTLEGSDEIAELAAEMDAMAASITEYTAELERSNSELDAFAAAVGHDLRSPLRAIKTIAAWLEADLKPLPAVACEHLDQLRDQVARMESMLQGLLHYAKASQVSGPLGDCNIEALSREQLKLLSPKKQVELRVSGDLPTLITPEPPLALVLRNLIDNAIKHHDRSLVNVDIDVSRLGRRVLFRVTDDGPGISDSDCAQLFSVLGKWDGRDRKGRPGVGNGLGLALIRRIVQRLGGSLELKSDGTARGTTVIFDWPIDCSMLPALIGPGLSLTPSLARAG